MWKNKENTMLHILSKKVKLGMVGPIHTFRIICYHARVGQKKQTYLLARPPPGGRVGMPLSVDRFLITVTKSGNPTSSGRESISKTTPDNVTQDSVTRAALSQEQSGRAE